MAETLTDALRIAARTWHPDPLRQSGPLAFTVLAVRNALGGALARLDTVSRCVDALSSEQSRRTQPNVESLEPIQQAVAAGVAAIHEWRSTYLAELGAQAGLPEIAKSLLESLEKFDIAPIERARLEYFRSREALDPLVKRRDELVREFNELGVDEMDPQKRLRYAPQEREFDRFAKSVEEQSHRTQHALETYVARVLSPRPEFTRERLRQLRAELEEGIDELDAIYAELHELPKVLEDSLRRKLRDDIAKRLNGVNMSLLTKRSLWA